MTGGLAAVLNGRRIREKERVKMVEDFMISSSAFVVDFSGDCRLFWRSISASHKYVLFGQAVLVVDLVIPGEAKETSIFELHSDHSKGCFDVSFNDQ